MQQTELLRKRNHLIYTSYFTFFLVHCVCVFLGIFKFQYYYPFFASGYLLFVGFALYKRVNERFIQLVILIGQNILVVFLTVQSIYLHNIFWLIAYLLLITIYKSHKINVIATIVVFVEVIVLWQFHPYAARVHEPTDILFISIFLLLILLIAVSIQTIYIRVVWQKVEQKTIARENDLLSREAYLRLFFEHANDAIAVFNLDETIIEINPAFEQLYGWSREECIGKKIPLVPPPSRLDADSRYQRLIEGESFTLLETQDMKKDGTIFDAQISLSPIYNAHQEMVALSLISRDISYVKENERLLLSAEKLKLAGEMAAGVAHEIRNPMTVISGFVQMMNMDPQSPYKDYTALIEKEIERIDMIISDFLVLARPQVTTTEQFNIIDVIDSVLLLFQYEFVNNAIDVHVTHEQYEVMIVGNKNQLTQVLMNIVKNAMEAIHTTGRIKIESIINQQHIHIYIRDNGVGIPPHIMQHIFEPFYTTKSKGTGLGMMITNKIVQDHDGDIKISSTEGVGTDVCVQLPIVVRETSDASL